MIKIVLYTFNKRENSTKRPTGGLEVTGSIKAPTSLINPSIEFSTGQIAPANLNYAYIADFGRYYFIEDWVFNDRTWTARMKVDVLATYRDIIGASTQYVTRSASLWNELLPDGLYPMTNLDQWINEDGGFPFLPSDTATGCYILSTVGAATPGTGASFYILSSNMMKEFMTKLLFTGNWWSVEGVSDGLMKQISNPLQYINSCYYLPIRYNSVVDALGTDAPLVTYINFGFWGVDCTAHLLQKLRTYSIGHNFTLTPHPQAAARGAWLNTPPYTDRILHIPSVGDIHLNLMATASEIHIDMVIDLVSGACTTGIVSERGSEGMYYSQAGIPIQISQKTVDFFGAISSAISATASTASSVAFGDYVGALSSIGNGIMSAASSLSPQVDKLGGSGISSVVLEKLYLKQRYHLMADDDLADRGRPLCQDVQISLLNGYIEVADADVEINGTSNENQEIKSYMESGFFYE